MNPLTINTDKQKGLQALINIKLSSNATVLLLTSKATDAWSALTHCKIDGIISIGQNSTSENGKWIFPFWLSREYLKELFK